MSPMAKELAKKGSVKCVYVLAGTDGYLLDAARGEVVSAVIGKADPQTCLASFDGDVELTAVLDELRTMPFLAPRRAVVVRDADAFVAANREELEKYLENPAKHSSLILMVLSWPSNTRLAKLVARVGQVYDCSAPQEGSLARWLSQAAARRGKKLDSRAAEMLEEWMGRDFASLDGEIEKLSLYVGARETITMEDISAVVTATAGPAAFALSNALTGGDAKAALAALEGMLRLRGDEFRVIGSIAWHVRRALSSAEQIRAGEPAERALPRMPFEQRNAFLSLLNRRPLAKLRNDMRLLLRADLAMKTGTSAHSALQELVVALCS